MFLRISYTIPSSLVFFLLSDWPELLEFLLSIWTSRSGLRTRTFLETESAPVRRRSTRPWSRNWRRRRRNRAKRCTPICWRKKKKEMHVKICFKKRFLNVRLNLHLSSQIGTNRFSTFHSCKSVVLIRPNLMTCCQAIFINARNVIWIIWYIASHVKVIVKYYYYKCFSP